MSLIDVSNYAQCVKMAEFAEFFDDRSSLYQETDSEFASLDEHDSGSDESSYVNIRYN